MLSPTRDERAHRAIIVGDVHATPAELRDCQALISGLATLRDRADTIIFLGDQFHTHAVVHLDVVDFWAKSVRGLRSLGFHVIMLVGNHDIESCGQLFPNALETLYGSGVTIVDKFMEIAPGVVAAPYYHDGEAFVADANRGWPTIHSTLICHQTFMGAQYDNGFYANDGIDPLRIDMQQIISGHIHTAAAFANVVYVGSPRWRTADDANKAKNVCVYDLSTKAFVESIPTSTWCSPIMSYDLTPENVDAFDPKFVHIPAGARVTVALRGPADWVGSEGDRYKAMGYAVRRLPNIVAAPRVSESVPVNDSFTAFLRGFRTPNGTDPKVLETMVKQCQST